MLRHPLMRKIFVIPKRCALALLFVSLVVLPFLQNKAILSAEQIVYEEAIAASLTDDHYFLPVDQNKTNPPRRVAPLRRFQRQRPQSLPTHGIKIDRSREQIIRREDWRPSVADAYWELIRAQSV